MRTAETTVEIDKHYEWLVENNHFAISSDCRDGGARTYARNVGGIVNAAQVLDVPLHFSHVFKQGHGVGSRMER